MAVAGGGDADESCGVEPERIEIVPLGGGRHRRRALAGGKADHPAFRHRAQMRRQHDFGMRGGDRRVKDRAQERASVGHDKAFVSRGYQLLSSPLMTSPNNCQRSPLNCINCNCSIG